MTKEELINQIIELKENCKKLAEEYRDRYNQDNEDRIALNMFYHNVISYNDYESVLALIENRNSVIMCFSAPPILTEGTVEINLKRIAELEKENKELKTKKIPQLARRIASIRGAHSVDCKKLNARTEQVERLKKQVSAMSKALVNVVSESDEIKDRLSKAIEVIRDYMRFEPMIGTCSFYSEEYKKTKTKAEQFLKEIEK